MPDEKINPNIVSEEQKQRLLSTRPLYSAEPDCDHEIEIRASGYGCTKCSGWYCA